jgi:ATP-dependent helicase/nuclease subunit A
VHKAKGLEFPIVVLPDLNSAAQGRSSRLLFGTGWQAAINTAEDDEAPIGAAWRVASLQDADDQHREDLRLMYVAMTRHEDYLLFIGADWRTRDGRFRSKGSWLDLLDEPLGLADAVDANLESVRYGGNRELIVGCRTPSAPPRRQGRKSKGARLLESAADCEQLGKSLAEGGDQASPPPLLGPIPAETGRIELAVTALSDYLLCPRLYYLRHELRLPGQAVFGPGGGQTRPEVDPLVLGTVLHRCMELLDFSAPQSPGQLLRRVRGELDLGPEWTNEPIETLLAEAIENITGSQLASDIREARSVHRELDFITTAGPAELRGQIDLLYADAEGCWHIVDYKSDRLGPDEDPAKHAGRYELQMLLYAVACGRFLEADPPPATLYFLRSGRSATLAWPAETARRRMEGVEQTALEMIRRRREGQFPAEVADGACRGCPYRSTCGR